jgi:ribosomal protein S18 acetylase RimI-like enzyme
MEVRLLTQADAEPFRRLRRERLDDSPRAFGESIAECESMSVSVVAQRLGSGSGDNFVVGAFDDGQLFGMAGFARNLREKSNHKGVIWGVYVRPGFRGRGVAQELLKTLVERAKSQAGLEQIVLSVAVDQTAARRLYKSLGFEVFGHERHALKVDGAYVDEDHMVLWLR